jgi:hypothetical protein
MMMTRFFTTSFNALFLSASLCCFSLPLYADEPSSSEQVTSTQDPLISTQELESLVSRCPSEVEALHEKRRDVARDKAREYSVMLGVASDDCMKLRKVIDWLRVGSKLKIHYEQNLERAKRALDTSHAGQDFSQDPMGSQSVEGGHTYDDDAVQSAPLDLE